MDGTIAIALAMILAIVLVVGALVIAASRQTKKKKNELLNEVNQLAAKHQLRIGHSEVFRNRIISLDRDKRELIYVVNHDADFTHSVIDLDSVDKCEIVKGGSRRTEMQKSGKTAVEEHISEIQLKLYAQKEEVAGLTFYSEIEDGAADMIDNHNKAQDWKTIISNLTNHK